MWLPEGQTSAGSWSFDFFARQIRKTSKLPPAAVDVVAAMVDESFTTDDSAAASAAGSATASARPSPSASPNGTLGGGDRTRRTATNSSGAKRKRTV